MAGTYRSKTDAIECEVMRPYQIANMSGVPRIEAAAEILPLGAEETGYIASRFEGTAPVWYCTRTDPEDFFALVQEAVNRIML